MVRAVPSGKKGVSKIVPSRGEGTVTTPIVREKWASDELAVKALRLETKKQKSRNAGKQGKKFNPTSNKKFR